jgi:hypothetical protein
MKRRNFLGFLGAAIAAPALPAIAPAATAATYNRYTYGLAVFHARTRAHVSARGIAYCLKVPTAQAEAMIAEMSANGLVKPVFGAGGNVRAVSNILKPDAWGLDKAARKARSDARRRNQAETAKPTTPTPDTMMAHLHQMCRDYGMTLSPRCAAV